MSLRRYEQDKFAIAAMLRSAANIVPADDQAMHERIHDLFVRLAEDRFNLVVVGRFNRGKTTLMNAILGSDRLPVGIIPLTSVITTISYGTKEQVFLRFNGSRLSSEIPVSALREYVTQEGNPGNERDIKIADVKLRAEILRRGFFFVDTPGIGSAIEANTHTTESYLPEADAFLLVTSYESPLTEEEIRFLKEASTSGRQIFVVINKRDAVTVEEHKIVLDFVCDQLNGIFSQSAPRLFFVSASEGLDAKRCRDLERLSKSGIPALEEELIGFLIAEKRSQVIRQMCRRAADLVRSLPSSAETVRLKWQADELLERLAPPRPSTVPTDVAQASDILNTPGTEQLRTCEVCRDINDALWKFQSQFQYEISANQATQERFAESGGLCAFHTWQYQSIASSYGICSAYPALLDHLAKTLRTAAIQIQQDVSAATSVECAVCKVRSAAESEAISGLTSRLSQNIAQTLDSLSAVCIPHLTMTARALDDPAHVRKLLDHQSALLERISEDMRRYTLKRDATRRSLETKEETIAAERALLLVAGHRNVIAGTALDPMCPRGGSKTR